MNNEHEDNQETQSKFYFERMSCIDDTDFEEYMDDEAFSIEIRRLIDQENKQILPHQEEIEVINLGSNEENKEVKVGTAEAKKEIIDLIHKFVDVFAWSYQDMSGLNTKVVEHCLSLKPECKPIQQKLKRMKPKMLLKIKKVKKQFDAGFLEVAKYPNGWPILCQSQRKMGRCEYMLIIRI